MNQLSLYTVLQRVAVCRSVLQYVAVCCSVLQRVAVCRSVLQYVAECCFLQRENIYRALLRVIGLVWRLI